MLFVIGIGLSSPKDITLRGLEAIKSSSKVFLEGYTSILMESQKEDLEMLYEQKVITTDREMVETQSDEIINDAQKENVAFLVVGDPFGATTHIDLLLRCDQKNIPYEIIHNVSVMNGIGACGLSLYNFGQTVSIPFFTDSWKPTSWLRNISQNYRLGLHTLCLLDIKVKEQSEENLARGKKIFEPPRFMTVPTAIQQILSSLEQDAKMADDLGPPNKILAIGICRLGASTQAFVGGTLHELFQANDDVFGDPLHCLIIIGKCINPIERDFMAKWALDRKRWQEIALRDYNCHD
ncbi:hypothetical protein O181_041932 [Austropuccinia psidii MF-1]|uniref:diphthine methyl ester synthase n=1 Tax=Austropuccinia psidii MF-1 TaxID=1389203 RepID=A0A9Q3DLR9_9BASI|nr:hypothetical protein [Austropuccinia psidii MF-1]